LLQEGSKHMSEQEMARILHNVKRSMEIEGFIIGDDLMEQGKRILNGNDRTEDVVARYVRDAKELGAKGRSSYER